MRMNENKIKGNWRLQNGIAEYYKRQDDLKAFKYYWPMCIIVVVFFVELSLFPSVPNSERSTTIEYSSNENSQNYSSGGSYSSNFGSDYSSNYSNDYNYDYDKGYGYTSPIEGESFSDYVKRQDPDLYNSMVDRYESLYD